MVARFKIQMALTIVCLMAAACTSSDSPEQAETTAVTQLPTTEVSIAPGDTESGDSTVASNARVEVALVFSYHEPYLPEIDGAIELSQARLSASRSYLDLPQLLEEFPAARASIAITAPTIAQLEALSNPRGAQRTVDRHYLVASKSPGDLTPDERQFILNNFFEGPPGAFETLERWDLLRELRDAGSTLTDADLGDIAVLFHLAQLDPELVAEDTNLSALVEQGSSFSVEDARQVLRAIDSQVDSISAKYTELYSTDRLEIITSTGRLPNADPLRTKENTTSALGVAADFVGKAPRGLTLVGDIASDTDLAAMAAGGAQWILAVSPNPNNQITAPQTLTVSGGSVEIIGADTTLTNLIATEYSELGAADATEDFLGRLGAIADTRSTANPPLVTVVIDGPFAFAEYENGGSTFLRTLINALTTNEDFAMTTPSRYLAQHPNSIQPLASAEPILSSDRSNWSGEPEEDAAAALIDQAVLALNRASGGLIDARDLEAANDLVANATAADFSFYFGQDQDSGHDQAYDRGFRQWLINGYIAADLEVPEELLTPIVPAVVVSAANVAAGEVAINIDGNPSDWARATLFDFADTNDVITEFGVAVDGDALALRFDGGLESEVQIYLGIPRNPPDRTTSLSGDSLGFGATHMVVWTDTEGACLAELLPPERLLDILPTGCISISSALSEAGVELKIPAELLGGVSAGDVVSVRLKTGSSLGPISGPIRAEIPVDSP